MNDITKTQPVPQGVPAFLLNEKTASAAFEVWQALQFTERAKPYLRQNAAWQLTRQDAYNRFLLAFEAL